MAVVGIVEIGVQVEQGVWEEHTVTTLQEVFDLVKGTDPSEPVNLTLKDNGHEISFSADD